MRTRLDAQIPLGRPKNRVFSVIESFEFLMRRSYGNLDMASKGIIFFTLGTVFGGLLSTVVMTSLPESKSTSQALGGSVKVVTKKGETKIVRVPAARCSEKTKPSLLPAIANGLAKLSQASEVREGGGDAANEGSEEQAWTDEDIKEFAAREEALFQEHQQRIDDMREDLVSKAGFSEKERSAFLALVEDVSHKLDASEKKMDSLMGPLPEIDTLGDSDGNSLPPLPDVDRKAMLQNELAMTQALLDAQRRYERLVGKERMKELGPEFNSVEMFIKSTPRTAPEEDAEDLD